MKYFIYALALTWLTSCFKMDDLPFLGEKISDYQFENYQGEKEIELPDSYNIPDSNIHLFTVNSKLPNETEGETIYAVYIGNLNTIQLDTVIVYCHGQSRHMDAYWERAKLLANTGEKNRFGVLMMDYRGYGLSTGKSTEESLYQDVRSCLDWLNLKGVSSQRVVMYGYSLGTIPAVDLSAFYTVASPNKLILEAPMASVENLTEEALLLDVSSTFFTSLKFDNVEKIKSVSQPLLWLHGIQDDYLSISNGEAIFEQYGGGYKEAHRVPGANHTDIPLILGFGQYSSTILNFITN